MRAPRFIVRKIMLGLVVLGFVMWLSASRRPQAPDLAANCAKAAFKLSTQTVEKGKPVAYRVVGAEGRMYALGFDVSTFSRTPDGGWDPVAKSGREDSVLILGDAKPLEGCTRSGVFGTSVVPAGEHTVTLFELTEAGPLFVEEQQFEVTDP